MDLTLHSDNGAPRGIWSDTSIMWVADFSDRKVYAYSLQDGSRLEDRDVSLGSSNFKPFGLWSNGTTIWALNTRDDRLYGYSLPDGSRDQTKDIRLDRENDIPAGIWSDGSSMYVVDQNDKKLYAYALEDGARESDKDIAFPIDRPRPLGVWGNESTFWISYDHHQDYTDDEDRILYAFSLEDGAREEHLDVQLSTDQNSRSSGIWSNGTTIWVTDTFHRKILAYELPQPTVSDDSSLSSLSLGAGTLTPEFASSTSSYTASVENEITEVTVFAATTNSFARIVFLDSNDNDLPDADALDPGHQVMLAVGDNAIMIRVTAEDESTVQTYLLTVTRERPKVSVMAVQEDVTEGVNADFVVFREGAVTEPLDVQLTVSETESLLPSTEEGDRTVTIPSTATSTTVRLTTEVNDDAWEEHSTVTVIIVEDDSYRVSDNAGSAKVRVLDDDFPEASAVLSVSPNPVTEGGAAVATITVTTSANRQPHGSGGTLSLSQDAGTAISDDYTTLSETSFPVSASDFSATGTGTSTRYQASYTATMGTVDDSVVEIGESFDVSMSRLAGSSDNLSLAQPPTLTVSILDNDASLSSLELSSITLSPEFSSDIYNYNAQVDYSVNETTVTASAGHSKSAEPKVMLGGVLDSDGTILLEVGDNEITVEVIAEDGLSTSTYTIIATRDRPDVSISAVESEVDEGQSVLFQVGRDTSVSQPLDVNVMVTESAALVPDASEGSRSVTIPGNATTTTLVIVTDPDDDLWEAHSVVTAEIVNSSDYQIAAGAATTSALIKDNDFPAATAALAVNPNPVSEGGTITVTLTVTTNSEQVPHGEGGTLTLNVSEDTARAADYGRFGQTSFQVRPSDFTLADDGGISRYRASYTAAVVITDDSDAEQDESFDIEVRKTDAPQIELPTPSVTSVVIAANDSSTDPTLSQLDVSPGELSPSFSSGTTTYSVSLAYGTEQITVIANANSDNSVISFLDGDGDSLSDANGSADGHQVDLTVGENIVKVKVTAEDGETTQTYTIAVSRQKPEVRIQSVSVEVTEGSDVLFVLARDALAAEKLDVQVKISESDAMVAGIEEGGRLATIPPNATSTVITVTTEPNDRDWETHSTVSATISTDDAYAIEPRLGSAETTVTDDDFPSAMATLAVDPAVVTEGVTSTLKITVTTKRDEKPHGGGGVLTLMPAGGTAQDEDYGSLSQTTFPIAATDFSRMDIGSSTMAYRAVYSASFETADDSESEPDEAIVFQLSKNADAASIEIEAPATATVTILANDASPDASLIGLGLSDGTLSSAFATSTTNYTAAVAYRVEYITLTPMKGADGATVAILDVDENVIDDADEAPGHQVKLAVGENTFKLKVRAEDRSATQTYVVTIARSKPLVGILGAAGSASEGDVLLFHVVRDAPVSEVLNITVNVAETNAMLAAGEVGEREITISAGATSTSFTLNSDAADNEWEEHSTVTASIVEDSAYEIKSGQGNTHVQVEDNDFPEATAALDLSPDPVDEGESVTAQVTVTTKAEQQPHGDGGTLIISVTGGTAEVDDFEPPDQAEFNVSPGDFASVAVNGSVRYRATYASTFTIADDAQTEPSETLKVSIAKRDADKISLPQSSTSTVTITPSDPLVEVTRARPEVGIRASARESLEGYVLGYTVVRSSPATATLEVVIEVVEDGDVVPDGSDGEGGRSVIIPVGASSTTFAVVTEDDDVWEDHSSVTATVKESDIYSTKAGEGSAKTVVLDDDFPESIAAMVVGPPSVFEGESVTATVTVTTVRNEAPHADGGQLSVSTADSTAISGVDYTDLNSTLNFAVSDFLPFENLGQTHYRASKQVTIDTHSDDVIEGAEKFDIVLERVTSSQSPTASQIALEAVSQPPGVVIWDRPEAELSALAVSEATLKPPFGPGTKNYSAEVPYGVEQITVIATTSRETTRVTYHDFHGNEIADQDDTASGHQLALKIGENAIKLSVSAADETVLDTYTLTINRAKPEASVTATTTTVLEGDKAVFIVARDAAPSEPLRVALSVTETGAMVSDALHGEGNRWATIPGNSTSTTLTVVTDADDETWEEHSTTAASVLPDAEYSISVDHSSSDIQVIDDDFPQATASLAVAPNSVTEGRPVTAIVTVTTLRDEEPHRDTGVIQLAVLGETATSGRDFTPPAEDQIVFSPSDFIESLLNGQRRYFASKQVSIATIVDSEFEGTESFSIGIVLVPGGADPTASQIALEPGESLRVVSISDSDNNQLGGGGGTGNDNPGAGQSSQNSGTNSASSGGGGGGAGRSGSASNRDPKFDEGEETIRSVPENSAVGTRLGQRVAASDNDGDRLRYSVSGEDQSSFTINESSGRLYTAVELDREEDSRYYVTVDVSDGRGGFDSIEVTIIVTDVDEAPVVTGEHVISHEEQVSGVIATYAANDPENGEIRWVLSGVDAGSFRLEAGELAFLSPPDFENPTDHDQDNSYSLSIEVSDGAYTSTLDVVVTVLDLDESPSATPTPLPTPRPASTPLPNPTPSVVPTMTPTVMPTSMPTPLPTQTPSPTMTPTTVPAPTASPSSVPTLIAISTVTPTPTPTPHDRPQETPTPAPTPSPSPTLTPATTLSQLTEPSPTQAPVAPFNLTFASPTPMGTPLPMVTSTGGGSVPAWLMLSITCWAILSTGVGVYVYLRHR